VGAMEGPNDWSEAKAQDGRTYYYSKSTGKTQWETPLEFVPAHDVSTSLTHDVEELTLTDN
jgi:hypothetical protein